MVYTDNMIREPTLFVLAALAQTPLHGYAIIKSVSRLSDGRVTLRAGTLYAALDRLVREGALDVDGEEIVDGRLRRRYRITAAGKRLLQESVERLEANAAAARTQLTRTSG